MTVVSKRRKAILEKVDANKTYSKTEAFEVLKSLPPVKFDETVELVVKLGIDTRKSDQSVRGAVVLPNGLGKKIRVAVFTQGANAEVASAAGADIVGMDDLAAEIKKGNMDFDVVIATPDAMRVVGGLGTILGPRGLMPNPKLGTVTADVKTAVENAKFGQAQFRADKGGIIHVPIGKLSATPEALIENLDAVMAALNKAKPESTKGTYIRKVSVTSTMGPGLPIEFAVG